MSIVTKEIKIGKRMYVQTMSDDEMFIERDGVLVSEALDPKEYGRTYNETNIPIDGETEAEKIIDILMGVEE